LHPRTGLNALYSGLSPVFACRRQSPAFAFHRPHPASAQRSRQYGAIGPPNHLLARHTTTGSLSTFDPFAFLSWRSCWPHIHYHHHHPTDAPASSFNPAFPTHYTRHALSTRNLVVQTFLACNPHSSFALSHRASVCACCLSPVVQPIPLAVGSAPSPASSRTLPPTLNFDPAWT
jgi:hypothetical protein